MRRLLLSAALATVFLVPGAQAQTAPPVGLNRIGHIVVLYLENRGFDNLFGLFPGANGLMNAAATATQVDRDGKPYAVLPPVIDTSARGPAKGQPVEDPRFPRDLPNQPFLIDGFVPPGEATGDLIHAFWHQQEQINGGKMDKFAAMSDAGGLVMGFYDGSKTEMWTIAREYALADNFFHAAFGGSFLNHMWLACACTPKYDNPPEALVAKLDANGKLVKNGSVTPDGYAVNTIQSAHQPHAASIADPTRLLPAQTAPTIGDRLSDKGVDWAWYSGGWDAAVAGNPDPRFQFHHQPFAYFARYADDTPDRAKHLKDEKDFLVAIDAGTLPPVAFFKPIGRDNQHAGYADVLTGDRRAAEIVRRIQGSPLWKDTVVIVTYDENGGFWDHVPPPKGDRWGPGVRVPAIVVSPFAKRGFIDHTPYDTTSILRLIEKRFDLAPLGERDAAANDLTNALMP